MSGTTAAAASTDRAAAVRSALRRLVAERGFHGASMGAIAAEAGVATGTAYVHYSSKEELIIAAYLETKRRLGEAAVAAVDPAVSPAERFQSLWLAAHRYFARRPEEARFLVQVDGSPYAERAHATTIERGDDPLMLTAAEPAMAAELLPLPPEVLYELGLAPAVRLVARGTPLGEADLAVVARACWRAISR